MNKKYDFYWSEKKKALVARGTNICVEYLGDGTWNAYRCQGIHPYLDFIGSSCEGPNPNSAINKLIKVEDEEKYEFY